MATPALAVQNGFSTTLSTAVASTDTVFYLASLPTGAEGYLTLDEGLSTQEVIYFTSKGANFVTLPSVAAGRGRDGTSAVGHSVNAVVKMKTTSSYWNALQDGTAMATNSITADKLATSAITLGYAQITSNFTTASTTATLVTGLTTTVTIPAGGRRVEITAYVEDTSNTASGVNTMTIWDGTAGSGTQLQQAEAKNRVAGDVTGFMQCMAIVTPSAGSKTYSIGFHVSSGTATFAALTTAPAFILVKAI